MIKKFKINKGFTLVEMLIAISLFIMVVTISLGALLSIFDANKKVQSSKTVVDNLNLSIENMARTVRFGSNYHCGSSGTLTSPLDCPNGDTFLAVTFYDQILGGNVIIAYRLNGTTIELSRNPGAYKAITAPEVKVEHLEFRVFNTGTDDKQPYVIAVIKGYVGNRPSNQTSFSIETLMSQRKLDL